MKNFKSLLCAILVLLMSTFNASSQVSVNSIDVPKAKEPVFIHEISFTPFGATQSETTQDENAAAGFNGVISESSALNSASSDVIEQCGSIQFKYATILDVPVESISFTNVYTFIDDWMGTRYRMGGTSKSGVDCSAFAGSLLLGCYALSIPRTAREQHKVATLVSREELTEGDLVFFNTTGGVSHVGVYLTNGYFVHSSSSQGVSISNLNDAYYAHRFVSAGRISQSVPLIENE